MKKWTTVCLTLAAACVLLGGVQAQDAGTKTETVIKEGLEGEIKIITRQQPIKERVREVVTEEAPAAPQKARVAVIPQILTPERSRQIANMLNLRFGITDPGAVTNPGFETYVTDSLVNTRKFDMLERRKLEHLIEEMEFGESDFVNPAKAREIGKMVGADYLIIPEIRYIEAEQEERDVPYLGRRSVSLKAKVATQVRAVDVETGRIVSSNIDEVEKKERVRQAQNNNAVRIAVLDLIADCYRELGIREAANIVDVAYPIRIMHVSDASVMLNRGKGAIMKGEELKVYATGEVMVDPDTKEVLGYHEDYVGKIKVTDVDQKTSKAKIIERQGVFKKLYICRRPTAPTLGKTMKTQPPPKID